MQVLDWMRDTLWGDDVRRTRTVISLVFLALSIVFLVGVWYWGGDTEVMRDRWRNASTLFSGSLPVMEYPPLALIFIAIPRIFASTVWGYEIGWVVMLFVVFVVGLEMISRTARTLGYSQRKAMWIYAVLMIIMLEFVIDRFDAIAMVLSLGALLLFLQKRYPWAFVVLAVATLVKVYPAVMFPVMLICLARSEGLKGAAKGFLAYAATGILVVAVCWIIDPDVITNFLSYNTDRPLQIESSAASIVYFLSRAGLSDWWIQPAVDVGAYGSVNLRGDMADAVADTILPLTVAVTVIVWLLYAVKAFRGSREPDMRLMALACLASVLVFVAFNKVYSTQYTIWFYAPFMLVLIMSGRRFGDRMAWLMIANAALGLLNYIFSYKILNADEFTDAGMLILLTRNAVTVILLCLTVREMWRCGTGRDDPPESAPAVTPADRAD
ncbi:MAG: glycosyltransferase 87 family protein [Thermoplasmata archaeon]|nr:glycosyltransferase 87 family protein [Thermoplasmata archaeon]